MKFSITLALVLAAALCLGAYAQEEGTAMIADNPVSTSAPGRDWSPLYYFEISNTIREVYVEMESNAADGGDPDLYIRFGAAPTLTEYDDRDYSPNHVDFASLRFIPSTAGKLYIRVHSYFNRTSNIKLTVRAYNCRNKNCGAAQQLGTCNAETGICTCNTAIPGRDYCQARYLPLAIDSFSNIFDGMLVNEEELLYKFDVVEPLPQNVQFHITRGAYDGSLRMYLQRGRAPNPATQDYTRTATMHALSTVFDIPQTQLNVGSWYFSIIADKVSRQRVQVGPRYHQCPNSCSGHGTCNFGNSTCSCERGYRSTPDCAVYHNALENHVPVNVTIPAFANSIFAFGISDVVAAAAADIIIRVRTHEQRSIYPAFFIKHGARPTNTDFHYRSPVPANNHTSVKIAHTDAREGEYYVVVNNDEATPLDTTVHFDIRGYCSPKCQEHGTCDDLGRCHCQSGWLGGDCSVPANSGGGGDSGVSVGILVVCIFLFLFIGLGAGVLIYRYCAKRSAMNNNESIQDQAYLRT